MKPSEVAAIKFCHGRADLCPDRWRAGPDRNCFRCVALAALLDRFAGEAVREERERCAKVADAHDCRAGRCPLEGEPCVGIGDEIRSAPGGGEGVAP